jgi:hypothetical protein
MSCPHCHAPDLEFDLATDEHIYLTFWTCPGCGHRGITRMIDRHPSPKHLPPAARGRSGLRSARRARRDRRQGLSRA